MSLRVFEDARELAEAAAGLFAEEARRTIEERGRFAVALAGGSTPERTYEVLATEYGGPAGLDWDRVHIFFGDERAVPPEDEDSNYRMVRRALLDLVPVGGVHRMQGELDPTEAAALYDEELGSFFEGEEPRLDLVLLGLGDDGHTASLFPRTPALDAGDRLAVENPVEELGTVRITLTLPALDASRRVAFLVSGAGKAEALREVVEGDANPRDYPAKLVRPRRNPDWFVDEAAASLLSGR